MTKRLLVAIIVAASLLLFSCKKESTRQLPENNAPEMEHIDLYDTVVKYKSPIIIFDFDKDGFSDLKFGVILVADPVEQKTKHQFRVVSGIHTKFAIDPTGEMPVLNKGQQVPLTNFNGYEWWLVSSVILVQRVENINGNVSWLGLWQGAVKKYLPFQLIKNEQRYNGWVEISVFTNEEKIILHRLALCKEPEKIISVGQE
ncbi:MAG: hypothetical protein QM791_15280 [Ferruginibacter sp.]